MPVPKSVVKINKNGIQYISYVDRANYTIRELTRAALRDVGKYIKRQYRYEYYKTFIKRSGNGPKGISYKVVKGGTELEIGVKHSSPGNEVPGYYTFFQELGTKKMAGRHLLKETTNRNIGTIVEIEGKYLSAIEDEAKTLALINEEEYSEDEA